MKADTLYLVAGLAVTATIFFLKEGTFLGLLILGLSVVVIILALLYPNSQSTLHRYRKQLLKTVIKIIAVGMHLFVFIFVITPFGVLLKLARFRQAAAQKSLGSSWKTENNSEIFNYLEPF